MPQQSNAYANGRIKVLEIKMLDTQKMNRIVECDAPEAYRLLQEAGYGSAAPSDGDFETLIRAELEFTSQTIKEITTDETITNLFLLKNDAHNIKVLIKARLLEKDYTDLLLSGGAFDVAVLQKAVAERDYRNLPQTITEQLNIMESRLAETGSVGDMSSAVDRAIYLYIEEVLKKTKHKFVKNYFVAQVDFTNVLSAMRARELGLSKSKLGAMLIPGGDISQEDLVDSIDCSMDMLVKKLANGRFKLAITQALEDYVQNSDATNFERIVSNVRIGLLKEQKHEVFALTPVVGYLVGREVEASAIRLAFAAKRSGYDPKLPELYA